MKKRLLFLAFASIYLTHVVQAQIIEDITATQADSLILANSSNPDFVILDVRRASEYNPEHLEGAINRNYYDSDFELQLDSLTKHKIYLIHCKSGGRSGQAKNIMGDLGFAEVYNMIGGINSWNSNGLAVTSDFAPVLMMVSDSIYDLKEVNIGNIDTIDLKVTNRANALLIFDEICSLDNPEFSTNFDPNTTLPGAFDYAFSIFYEPVDEIIDSLSFCILSDAGNIEVTIIRTGIDETSSAFISLKENEIRIYPNPVREHLYIELPDDRSSKIQIFDMFGNKVIDNQFTTSTKLDLSGLQSGTYILRMESNSILVIKYHK